MLKFAILSKFKNKSMKHLLSFSTALLIGLLISTSSNGQIKTPQPSSGASIKQDLGLSKVSIKYSRPGIKGRKIYGELVPFGKMWRTGANAPTSIKFTSDVSVEGQALKAGKYTILTIPGKVEWTLIFSNNADSRPASYKEEEDALRIKVKPKSYSETVETFTFNFTDVKTNALNVQLLWENTSVSFSVISDVESAVMKSINETMAGPSAGDYYDADKYYYENDKDLNKALEWVNISVDLSKEKPKFWVIHWQAKILAKSGKTKEAITSATLSKKLATEAKYDSYIKKNDDLLEELKSKK